MTSYTYGYILIVDKDKEQIDKARSSELIDNYIQGSGEGIEPQPVTLTLTLKTTTMKYQPKKVNKTDAEKFLYEAFNAYGKHREEMYKLGNDGKDIVSGSKEGYELANELSRILDFISYTLDNK